MASHKELAARFGAKNSVPAHAAAVDNAPAPAGAPAAAERDPDSDTEYTPLTREGLAGNATTPTTNSATTNNTADDGGAQARAAAYAARGGASMLSNTGGGMRQGGALRLLPETLRNNVQFTSNTGLARVAFGGWVLGAGLIGSALMAYFSDSDSAARQFFVWTFFMSIFHSAEFILTALHHPDTLTYSSFLLDHSREYHMAIAAAVVEFALEALLAPASWRVRSSVYGTVQVLGLVLIIGGQCVRSLAMSTARQSFTHQVADGARKQQHVLITHGIYQYCRHPSYAGWFWWCLGTQLWLCNPFCVVAYALVIWRFFAGRIPYEEAWLFQFFGADYRAYHKAVPFSGVPFVRTPCL